MRSDAVGVYFEENHEIVNDMMKEILSSHLKRVINFSASHALIYRNRFVLQLISFTQFIPSLFVVATPAVRPPQHFSFLFLFVFLVCLRILLKCVLRKYHVLMCTQLIFFSSLSTQSFSHKHMRTFVQLS